MPANNGLGWCPNTTFQGTISTLWKVNSNPLHQMENVLQDFGTVSSYWKQIWLRGVQGDFQTIDYPEVKPDNNLLYASGGLCEDTGSSLYHIPDPLSHWSRGRHRSGKNYHWQSHSRDRKHLAASIIFQVVREVHAKWRPYFYLADDLDQWIEIEIKKNYEKTPWFCLVLRPYINTQ